MDTKRKALLIITLLLAIVITGALLFYGCGKDKEELVPSTLPEETTTTAPQLASTTTSTAPELASTTTSTAPELTSTTITFPTTTSSTTTTTTTSTTTTTAGEQFTGETPSDHGGGIGADFNAIAVDSNNKPHISFADWNSGNLYYTAKTNGTWTLEAVDDSMTVGSDEDNSIAVDTNDNNKIHISYHDKWGNKGLRHAYTDSPFDLEYAQDTSGNIWEGAHNSIAIGSDSTIHIAYLYRTISGPHEVRYVSGTSGSGPWTNVTTIENLANGYGEISMALDGSNYPHISYYYWGSGPEYDLKYAYKDGTGWHIETVEATANVGKYNSITLDSSGYPHISYYNDTSDDLKYAYKDGGGWHTETVDSTNDVGRYNSIARDSSNTIYIVYKDVTSDDFKYAYGSAGSWTTDVLTTEGGNFSSIVVDNENKIHFSYTNWDGDLRYIKKNW